MHGNVVNGHVIHTGNCGVRPLVKLPADARVVEQDGVWKIRGVATTEVQAPNYGDKIQYSANGVEDWKVFLNDGKNVYLIASDNVPHSGMNITAQVTTSGEDIIAGAGSSREDLLGWMQTQVNWSNYASGFNRATAVGGPTVAQFWASYNGKYGTSYVVEEISLRDHIGYQDTLYFPRQTSVAEQAGYWLIGAASRYYKNVNYIDLCGASLISAYWNAYIGIRPLIKLPANAKASRNSDKTWTFRE